MEGAPLDLMDPTLEGSYARNKKSLDASISPCCASKMIRAPGLPWQHVVTCLLSMHCVDNSLSIPICSASTI
ncbi:hypothetical protein RHMOL_Rhmol05G0229900 [Rhododendron molle]|uniref:Uncharacterized protein n=1 Tax=Rhododendron molle TaxID=49168 RepID=A0ACC0NSC0_RHOML|nr:hypothetical protein RHMOL_Rhmol05G0229900 [Rhododendron molle]